MWVGQSQNPSSFSKRTFRSDFFTLPLVPTHPRYGPRASFLTIAFQHFFLMTEFDGSASLMYMSPLVLYLPRTFVGPPLTYPSLSLFELALPSQQRPSMLFRVMKPLVACQRRMMTLTPPTSSVIRCKVVSHQGRASSCSWVSATPEKRV